MISIKRSRSLTLTVASSPAMVKLASAEAFMAAACANYLTNPSQPAANSTQPLASINDERGSPQTNDVHTLLPTVTRQSSFSKFPVTSSVTKMKVLLPAGAKQDLSSKLPTIKTKSPEPQHSLHMKSTSPPDLMSMDIGQELSEQRVLGFSEVPPTAKPPTPIINPMDHLRALEHSGYLDKELIALIRNAVYSSIQGQVIAKLMHESKSIATLPEDAAISKEPSRAVKYSQPEPKSLRPHTTSDSPPEISSTFPRAHGVTHGVQKPPNPFASQNTGITTTSERNSTAQGATSPTGTRPRSPQVAFDSLKKNINTEDNPTEFRVIPLQSASPTQVNRSLAQRLADQRKAIIGEHIHRTRFQPPVQPLIEGFKTLSLDGCISTAVIPETSRKSSPNQLSIPKLKSASPELPSHLRTLAHGTDHGAAARAQYGIPDLAAPIFEIQSHNSSISHICQIPPSLITRNQVATKPSAAARSHVSMKSEPSLPAHLRGQSTLDAGAAARAQYGNVLAPAGNSVKTLIPVLKGDSTTPIKAHHGSNVNGSGFIGLAQLARSGMKSEDDPIRIASSKGF